MGGRECVEVYFGWLGVGGHFFWVGGGGWRYILGGWGWVEVYFGWVGVGGGECGLVGMSGAGHSF